MGQVCIGQNREAFRRRSFLGSLVELIQWYHKTNDYGIPYFLQNSMLSRVLFCSCFECAFTSVNLICLDLMFACVCSYG